MSFNFRLPNITATTQEGKMQQLCSFLYQTVEQLNWAMNAIETSTGSDVVYRPGTSAAGATDSGKDATASFNEIKALIIKSADIIEAYYESIVTKLDGKYLAISDFGTYAEDTTRVIEENAQYTLDTFINLQQLVTELNQTLLDTTAYIKTGILDYNDDGTPIFGMEVGQTTEKDGEETFNKYARFTSNELSFFDQNGFKVAYISDSKLYITHIEVTGSYKLGKLVDTVRTDGSVITKYYAGG